MNYEFWTNYSKAWHDFKKTKEYKSLSAALKKQGFKQPYRDNVIRIAFSAGWNATGIVIKEINL